MNNNRYYKAEKQRTYMILAFCFIIFNYLALIFAYSADIIHSDNLIEVFNYTISNYQPIAIKFNSTYLLVANVSWILFALYLTADLSLKKSMRPGEEHGSARWFTDYKGYNKKYVDAKDETNMIFSEEVKLNMNTHKTRKNCNSLIIGGSGTGKSRFFVKPNILQANCSYVITDPSGELLQTEGKFLKNQGYKVVVYNLVDINQSSHYNPFHYIRNEEGVLEMVNCLIQNTDNGKKSGGDPFWEKSEKAFLLALCFYLIEMVPKNQQNFTNVIKLLNLCEVREDDPDFKNALDIMMDDLEIQNPTSMAVKNWKTFKQAKGKTAMSILISAAVRLNVFNFPAIRNLTDTDDIHLETIGDQKIALFVVIPSTSDTFNFLVSLMYSQLFESLYYKAEHNSNKRLPYHVRFLLDEFP